MERGRNKAEADRMLGSSSHRDRESVSSFETIASEKIVAPPDGGWGWAVVFGAFITAFVLEGVTGSFGVVIVELLEYFQADNATTALAGSLVVGCFLTFGAISGPMVSRFGCRSVAFVGGLTTSTAMVLCTFSPNIEIFILTYGVLAGIGLGLVYVPSMLIVNFYFDKKRGVVSGIVTSGAGFGVVVLAKLTEALLKEYSWKGTQMIIAGVALNLCVCAALFRPLKAKRQVLPDHVECDEDAEEVIVIEEEDTTHGKPQIKPIASWYPPTTFVSQTMSNCLFSSHYTSLPIGKQEPFNSRSVTASDMVPVSGRHGCRSTEGLNITKGEFGPGRLYSSMFTVNTPSTPDRNRRARTKRPVEMVSMNPLMRKDIFFSGSVVSLEQFKSQPDMKHYIASITVDENDARLPSPKGDTDRKTCPAIIDLSLFKCPTFLVFCLSSMLIQLAGFIPPFYLGNYAVSVGLEVTDVSTYLACIGFSCILGRLISGALASWKPRLCLSIMAVSLTLTGVMCLLFPFCRSFLHICVISGFFGFFIGFFPPIQPILLVNYLGLERLSTSFGLLTGLKGLATMAGPPLAGLLLEATGTFVAPFCFGGVCMVLAGLMHSIVPFLGLSDGSHNSVEVEVVSCESGSQTEESLVDSDEESSRKACLHSVPCEVVET